MSASRGAGPLHRAAHGPPPRSGEEFSERAALLAGQAGVAFGWAPEAFWRATPTELMALVRAVTGETVAPPDRATIAKLMEAYPDG